jgi:hypothetical protein
MRKVFPGIVWYVLISVSIASVLGACIKPVDVKPFPKGKPSGIGVDVGVEPLNDIPPELEATFQEAESPVTVTDEEKINVGNGDIIRVTNVDKDKYDAVEWYFNSTSLLTTKQGVSGSIGETLTVNTGVAPFDVPGLYSFAVIGKKGDKRYSILFYINVGS